MTFQIFVYTSWAGQDERGEDKKIEEVMEHEINNFVHPACAVKILEVNDVKQAIQKTLKELKEEVGKYEKEDKDILVTSDFDGIVDTIFKQNFGSLMENSNG